MKPFNSKSELFETTYSVVVGSTYCPVFLFIQNPINRLHLYHIATCGELKLPFVTRGEFMIPATCGFATRGGNYTISNPPPEGIATMTA